MWFAKNMYVLVTPGKVLITSILIIGGLKTLRSPVVGRGFFFHRHYVLKVLTLEVFFSTLKISIGTEKGVPFLSFIMC